MLTIQHLDMIYEKLSNDEAFCRLVYYGENPLSSDKPDIMSLPSHKAIMDDIIRFSPQIHDLEVEEQVRVCLFKEFTKLNVGKGAVRLETISFDLFVPHRLVALDKRVYQIENKIVSLIDGMQLGVGFIEYANGRFMDIVNVIGYAQYSMTFSMEEGRKPMYGRY